MGCDIHSFAERKTADGWEEIEFTPCPFKHRVYSKFAFLAGVRNYSYIVPISEARGFPEDAAQWMKDTYEGDGDLHSASWLSVAELVAFDYDSLCEDRRVMINGNGGSTCPEGAGITMTYREYLGPHFFEELEKLQQSGADRLVFWFDN